MEKTVSPAEVCLESADREKITAVNIEHRLCKYI
jgi:hypothetical protein